MNGLWLSVRGMRPEQLPEKKEDIEKDGKESR